MNEIVHEEDMKKNLKSFYDNKKKKKSGIDILFIDRILAHNKLWNRSISFNNNHIDVFKIINDFKLKKIGWM